MSSRPAVDAAGALRGARAAPGNRQAVAALLEAQFHHMGRDVTHPGGNLLRRMGFVRQPPPPGTRRAVARYVRPGGSSLVAIWPFALCIGDERGAAIVPRRGRVSWWPLACQPDCFTVRELGVVRAGCSPCPEPLLRRVFLWLAEYEETVDRLVGTAHREPAEAAARAAPGGGYALHASWRTHAYAGYAR